MIPTITRLVSPFPDATRTCIRVKTGRTFVMPFSYVNTCVVYTNGETILHQSQLEPCKEPGYFHIHFWTDQRGITDVATILVGLSHGDWNLETITVHTSSETMVLKHDDDVLNDCAYVPTYPIVPPSPDKIEKGLKEYSTLKSKMMGVHALLTGLGVGISHMIHVSDQTSCYFAVGGITGLIYQMLIQIEIDQIGNENKNILYKLLANSFFRLSFISSLFMIGSTGVPSMNTSVFSALCAGFLMNKLALYITFSERSN